MAKEIFYHNTIKNLIAAFGMIFNNISFYNDYDKIIKVPLHYSPKEKFIDINAERGDYETGTNYFTTLPRMGFEFTETPTYAPERMSNPLSKIANDVGNGHILTRLPYDFDANLYIATKKQEEMFKIIEQILPMFIPELNITINDIEGYNFKTDIPVVYTGGSMEIEYEGDYTTRRSWWLCTMNFKMKAWLYGDEKRRQVIKKTIIDMNQMDMNKTYETLMAEVQPFEASKTDVYTILETKIENFNM